MNSSRETATWSTSTPPIGAWAPPRAAPTRCPATSSALAPTTGHGRCGSCEADGGGRVADLGVRCGISGDHIVEERVVAAQRGRGRVGAHRAPPARDACPARRPERAAELLNRQRGAKVSEAQPVSQRPPRQGGGDEPRPEDVTGASRVKYVHIQ